MTAKAILPSAKPSNVAEAFVMMPTISTLGCNFRSNLTVDGSLDNFDHFSFQYVAAAGLHGGRNCFNVSRHGNPLCRIGQERNITRSAQLASLRHNICSLSSV